ncbi:MAG: hypothetical protein K6G38_02345 [Gammaproteobacteria bacterium]|nr:hypothetical protein [Gammaproteobacteria bacterium]
MKLFKDIKESNDKMNSFYSDKELRNASLAAATFTLVIGIAIALLTVTFFQVFVYMPYLAYTVSGLALLWLIIMYYFFYFSNLRYIRKPEDFSLFKANLIEISIMIIGIIFIVALLELVTIPIFFL